MKIIKKGAKMKNTQLIKLTAIMIAFWGLSACATTAKIWAPYDKITITSSSKANPDINNKASPVQIKIYELTSRSTFDNLDFDRAFYNAKSVLSDELLSEEEYTIQPSEKIKHTVNLQKETKFIAILSGFIDVDNARWKHIYKVSPYGHYNRDISIIGKSIIEGEVSNDELENDEKIIDKLEESVKKDNNIT